MTFINIALASIWLLVGSLSPVMAEESPQQVLESKLNQFVSAFKDPKYQGGTHLEEQDKRVWDLIHQIFDFQGISRRAVGRNWKSFSPQQQERFSKFFAKLLGNTYLKKIRENYTNQEVRITGQQKLSDRRYLVTSFIVRQGAEDIPVDYAVWNRTGPWLIYDVKVEGVSLVKNYRAQFNQILLNHDPDYLINKLKKKVGG